MFNKNVNEDLKLTKKMEYKVAETCLKITNNEIKHFIIIGLDDDGNTIQMHHGHGIVLSGLVRDIQREIDQENDHTRNASDFIKMMQKPHVQQDDE